MVIMAERVSPSEIPLEINSGLYIQPPAKILPLSINRRLGGLDSYTYVYAGKLPLRIENRISDRQSNAMPLAINRPHSTVLSALYVSSRSLPLSITKQLSDQPIASALSLSIDREHSTLVRTESLEPEAQTIAVASWLSNDFGIALVRYLDRTLLPIGFDASLYGTAILQIEITEGYFNSNRLKLPIAASMDMRPPSSHLPFSIHREHGQWLSRPVVTPSNSKYLYPKTFIDGNVSQPNISLDKQYALCIGIDSLKFGVSSLKSSKEFLRTVGWLSSKLSIGASIVNRNQRITTTGLVSLQTGTPLIYNLTQYCYLSGFAASLYGSAYLIGGVKYLKPSGINSNVFSATVVTNTTANQTANPSGINSLPISPPTVSPRMLLPNGINSLLMSVPAVRDPSLKTIGETHTKYGQPTIWFHTRLLAPIGILAYESGYLRIADPTQFIQTPSLLTSAIFGDTAIKNVSGIVRAVGIEGGAFSDYTTLTNSNRYYKPSGINSLAIGTAAIVNNTPSIFVNGIAPFDTGTPAIGHAIRTVQPTGFDHLLLGRATLTKTPELLPRGHQSSVMGATIVWYKNRAINLSQQGINGFRSGTPTAWYGQRPIKPMSWQTARYGTPTLTHEVREVIAQGFRRDAYGIAWVSYGTRSIEPTGIYTDFLSNHMVGGTQIIKPVGYEATLWGERIIPISQSVAPLGFAGTFGLTTADLATKYIAPVGYISVGQQPADRWGDIVVYNKLQYIIQEYDVNSGLVPPKWSDWTAIANRNIQMRVTGFASQRFGYSQIDNNATPLLPEAIKPPPITIGMISHGIRTIAPEAIQPPILSTWGVVHNAGRVIAPSGYDSAAYGSSVSVINTRREYRNVGRIDSLETGTPAIGYAIRTIDIEPRYSIAPPQINLPTIDLHTKYVTFNGYETAKYGLPSLSIHFNIIGPSWRHRDEFGESAVRNATPELQVGAFDSQEFGQAALRTQWRHVQAQGDTATLFGSAMIADTKREITIRGWQDSGISQKHTVTRTGAPPYSTQNIWLQNESNPSKDGFGIKPTSEPSRPGLNQNVLYARGFVATKFGEAVVTSNNLYIDIGISIKNFGTGTSVINKNRYIDVKGMDYTIRVSDKLGVTPFYIRPRSFNHEGDGSTFGGSKLGYPTLTNQHRTIYPQGRSSSNVGYGAKVELQTRYVQPPTIRGFAMGFPEIPFTPKTINLNDYGFNSEAHGKPTVERPPYTGPQIISARGFNDFKTGNQRVELLNRELKAFGSNSLQMGVSKQSDSPYMWQGLRVGEFVPMSIGAGDTSSFGETAIGLRVREIPVEGFVAFRSEYEPARFKDRMKVTRSQNQNEDALIQGIGTIGIDSEAMGAINIKWGQQFIRPDGNSDQFRKGAF